MNLKCGSFFAGVGGIDKGFEMAGFETVYANEFDKHAGVTFSENFPDTKLDLCDIRDLVPENIPDFDIVLAGFPCQAFSVAGYRQGFNDEKGRGNLFFDLAKIIEAKQPSILFLENVKNLVGHDGGKTFRVISETLKELGYHTKHMVMNAAHYGDVPQTRERIYIVSFKNIEHYKNFDFPKPIELKKSLQDVIDFDNKVDEKFYYTKNSCSFFGELKKNIRRSDTVFQWRRVYVRENKSNLCPTLTANMGTGGHNVPLIKTHSGKIRKLTPRECFNLQGFPDDFILPEKLSNSALYKQAGNSVVVTVIERIAKAIKTAIQE